MLRRRGEKPTARLLSRALSQADAGALARLRAGLRALGLREAWSFAGPAVGWQLAFLRRDGDVACRLLPARSPAAGVARVPAEAVARLPPALAERVRAFPARAGTHRVELAMRTRRDEAHFLAIARELR